MAFNIKLAERIREYLHTIPGLVIEEKKMFRGLTFMVNGKMCVCVSGQNLMCRFAPVLQAGLSAKKGFRLMVMKGKAYSGYCYVSLDGITTKRDFEFWLKLCLDFNKKAKSSQK